MYREILTLAGSKGRQVHDVAHTITLVNVYVDLLVFTRIASTS